MSNISNNIFNIIIFSKFEQKIFILPTQHIKSFCEIVKVLTNGKYLLVNSFSFGDKAFFSRLVYYYSCKSLGPLF